MHARLALLSAAIILASAVAAKDAPPKVEGTQPMVHITLDTGRSASTALPNVAHVHCKGAGDPADPPLLRLGTCLMPPVSRPDCPAPIAGMVATGCTACGSATFDAPAAGNACADDGVSLGPQVQSGGQLSVSPTVAWTRGALQPGQAAWLRVDAQGPSAAYLLLDWTMLGSGTSGINSTQPVLLVPGDYDLSATIVSHASATAPAASGGLLAAGETENYVLHVAADKDAGLSASLTPVPPWTSALGPASPGERARTRIPRRVSFGR